MEIELIERALDGDAGAWELVVVELQSIALRQLVTSTQVERRLRRARLGGLGALAGPDELRDAIESTGDFGAALLDRVDKRLFGDAARIRLLDRIRHRAESTGRLGQAEVSWAASLYVTTPALEGADRTTSVRKSLETQFRTAQAKGILDELVVVSLRDQANWRTLLDTAQAEGLVGADGPVCRQGRRWVLFTSFAAANGGGKYGVIGCSRVVGLPGLVRGIREADDPVAAFRNMPRARYRRCIEATTGIAPIASQPARIRGKRPTMPREECHRVFSTLARRIGLPVARARFFGVIYERLLPDHPAFLETLKVMQQASLQGKVVDPEALVHLRDARRDEGQRPDHEGESPPPGLGEWADGW